MLMLQQQAVLTVPTWAGTVTALSLLVIALSVLVLTIGAIRLALRLTGEIEERRTLINSVAHDAQETMESIRKLVGDGERIANMVRDEAGAFVRTGRRLRKKVNRGIDRIEARLVDLEALYDVVHDEVEETALDVATGLRRIRRGRGIAGRMTRFLLRR
ncbi:MAG TPA: hypothetical protein VFL88_10130 [Gemmatimonadales bacterium]|jgi:hypothetical protein|nr:hypothetical protein [Gemmatimonadales bacterium]